jgi:hypothetical protein
VLASRGWFRSIKASIVVSSQKPGGEVYEEEGIFL